MEAQTRFSHTTPEIPEIYGYDRIASRFTGYFRDAETGLDYADQRYHQPGMGRFLTPDRGGPTPSSPGSWNRYAYVAGDPVNRVDHTGLDLSGVDDMGDGTGDDSCGANWMTDASLMGPCGGGSGAGDSSSVCSVLSSSPFDPTPLPPVCADPAAYIAPEEAPAPDCNQTLTAEITGFTAGSPMAGLAATFMQWAATYNVDPRFIVALADAESGLGRNQGNACNDFGYFYNGYQTCSPFQSYDSEIHSVTKNIRTRHLGKGQKTAQQVFNSGGPLSYCNGDCSAGLNTITTDMGKMGANPSNLLFPCNPDGTWKKQ